MKITNKELIKYLEFGLIGVDECRSWASDKATKEDRTKDLARLNLILDAVEQDRLEIK